MVVVHNEKTTCSIVAWTSVV